MGFATRTEHWRQRLAECERLLADKPSRANWLRRTYARIYRFLLAAYGDLPAAKPPTAMPFVDATDELAGKSPKTLGEIRTTLKNIHNAQIAEQAPAGPYSRGMKPEYWCSILGSWGALDLDKCLAQLGELGIKARIIGHGQSRTLQVRFADSARASQAIAEKKSQLQPFTKRRIDGESALLNVLVPISIFLLALPVTTAAAGLVFGGPVAAMWNLWFYSGLIAGGVAVALAIERYQRRRRNS